MTQFSEPTSAKAFFESFTILFGELSISWTCFCSGKKVLLSFSSCSVCRELWSSCLHGSVFGRLATSFLRSESWTCSFSSFCSTELSQFFCDSSVILFSVEMMADFYEINKIHVIAIHILYSSFFPPLLNVTTSLQMWLICIQWIYKTYLK